MKLHVCRDSINMCYYIQYRNNLTWNVETNGFPFQNKLSKLYNEQGRLCGFIFCKIHLYYLPKKTLLISIDSIIRETTPSSPWVIQSHTSWLYGLFGETTCGKCRYIYQSHGSHGNGPVLGTQLFSDIHRVSRLASVPLHVPLHARPHPPRCVPPAPISTALTGTGRTAFTLKLKAFRFMFSVDKFALQCVQKLQYSLLGL